MATSRGERAVEGYAEWVIRWRFGVLLAALVVAGIAMAGVARLSPAIDYRYHFTEEHPELVAFNHLEDTYTKFDNILFVVAPRSGDVFDATALDALLWLTEQGWQLPHSIRVDSITNYQHTWSHDDDLIVEDLFEGPDDRERTRRVALSEPQLANALISNDGRAAAVNVTIQLPELAGAEAETARAGYQLADAVREQYPELHVAVTGSVPLTYALQQAPLQDMSTLLPAMYGTLLLAMFLFLRSFWGVLALLLTVAFSAGSAMGVAGWLGIPVSPPMSSAPTIVLTIAIADGIHILVTLGKAMRNGATRDEALRSSLLANWQPVFLTSLTTVVGFASLNLNGVPPLQDLGNVTAIGVVAAWFFSVTFLPAFVAIVPYRVRPVRSSGGWSMERYAEWVVRQRRA